jgi:hypothetical protein
MLGSRFGASLDETGKREGSLSTDLGSVAYITLGQVTLELYF